MNYERAINVKEEELRYLEMEHKRELREKLNVNSISLLHIIHKQIRDLVKQRNIK